MNLCQYCQSEHTPVITHAHYLLKLNSGDVSRMKMMRMGHLKMRETPLIMTKTMRTETVLRTMRGAAGDETIVLAWTCMITSAAGQICLVME